MTRHAAIALALATSLFLVPSPAFAVGDRNATDLEAMANFADGKTGTVVWHSRRSGPMRIWASDLNGQNLRQLSPDVAIRDHGAPLISPDGTRVVYYETFVLTDSSYYDDHTGDMMMINVDGSGVTTLVEDVRTYFEFRFARWLDDDRIAYIGNDHDGYVYTISSNSSEKLFDYPYTSFGAIPNQQLTYAIDGKNRIFTISNPGPSGTLNEQIDFDGCQGMLSYDGQWAYRMEASTHHITRMALGSWEETSILDNHSPLLPSSQDYIYFPQINITQEYLTFGSSPNQHNHFNSDYDIFIVAIDPNTLMTTGDPVKFSFDSAMDSFPDIWAAPAAPPTPELTRIDVSAPSPVIRINTAAELTAELRDGTGQPFAAAVTWSVSGGGTITAAEAGATASEHRATFQSDGSEGNFTVQVTSDSVSGSITVGVIAVHLPMQINCGSNDHDVDGWTRDDGFVSGGQDWTNASEVETNGVTNAAPAGVYRSVRHMAPHYYDLLVPNGTYTLRLHFADAYTDRSMNYFIEGEHRLADFDPASEAGGINRALVKELEIVVGDGNGLQIEVQGPGDAFEAAIELFLIEEATGTPPDTTPGTDPEIETDADVDGEVATVPITITGGCNAAKPAPLAALLVLIGLAWRRRRS